LDRHAAAENLPGFQWVFALCGFFGVCDILIHLGVREPEPARPSASQSLASRIRAPFLRREFRQLTAAMFFWTAAQSVLGYTIGMPGFFSMVHLKTTFGASFSQASLIFLFNALGSALCTPWLGRWMDRVGAHAVLLRLLALAPLSQMGWWLLPRSTLEFAGIQWPVAVLWMIPVSLVQGALFSGALLCQFRLTQMSTMAEGRTLSMALHWSLSGIGGALGALGAGMLQDAFSRGNFLLETLPGLWTSFDVLVLIQACLTWAGALPLIRAYAQPPGPARVQVS
jgi:hypothetical protein